jgi:hypothetical protein
MNKKIKSRDLKLRPTLDTFKLFSFGEKALTLGTLDTLGTLGTFFTRQVKYPTVA